MYCLLHLYICYIIFDMDTDMNLLLNQENKVLIVDLSRIKKKKKTSNANDNKNTSPKQKKKRVITEDQKKWNTDVIQNMDENTQLEILQFMMPNKDNMSVTTNLIIYAKIMKLIHSQISNKIHSYRSQDTEKGILSIDEFIRFETVLEKIINCQLKCFYCKESMKLLYEFVREPKQWTVERIDNSRGHNCDNIEIACLTCNLRRKTMYHERYIFTKQVKIVKSSE